MRTYNFIGKQTIEIDIKCSVDFGIYKHIVTLGYDVEGSDVIC